MRWIQTKWLSAAYSASVYIRRQLKPFYLYDQAVKTYYMSERKVWKEVPAWRRLWVPRAAHVWICWSQIKLSCFVRRSEYLKPIEKKHTTETTAWAASQNVALQDYMSNDCMRSLLKKISISCFWFYSHGRSKAGTVIFVLRAAAWIIPPRDPLTAACPNKSADQQLLNDVCFTDHSTLK